MLYMSMKRCLGCSRDEIATVRYPVTDVDTPLKFRRRSIESAQQPRSYPRVTQTQSRIKKPKRQGTETYLFYKTSYAL